MSRPVIITDNGLRARLEFPGARILTRAADVLDLPDGTPVRVVSYRVGTASDEPLAAARALIARGALTAEDEG